MLICVVIRPIDDLGRSSRNRLCASPWDRLRHVGRRGAFRARSNEEFAASFFRRCCVLLDCRTICFQSTLSCFWPWGYVNDRNHAGMPMTRKVRLVMCWVLTVVLRWRRHVIVSNAEVSHRDRRKSPVHGSTRWLHLVDAFDAHYIDVQGTFLTLHGSGDRRWLTPTSRNDDAPLNDLSR